MIGAVISGIGSITSAFGASQNAAAIADAIDDNIRDEKKLYKKWSSELDTMMDSKEDKLYNLGNIFDRFESTGAFGDTETLKNLRQAQSDFSALAAGDFSGFESQLRKAMSDALVNTTGTGAPVGTFAGLAADTMFSFREQGMKDAMSVTEFLSNESNKLLGLEFGVMDQRFESGYNLDRTKTTNIAAARLGQAATEGVGLAAFGNALTQVGALGTSYNRFNQAYNLQEAALTRTNMNINRNASQRPVSMSSALSPLSNISSGSVYGTGGMVDLPSESNIQWNGEIWGLGPDGQNYFDALGGPMVLPTI